MKWNETFILLLCGTIMGGVFMPIFMTDILGHNRMIEWFPADWKFDWGSFSGGLLGATAAVAAVMFQRSFDTKKMRVSVEAKYWPSIELTEKIFASIDTVMNQYTLLRDTGGYSGVSAAQLIDFDNLIRSADGEIDASINRMNFFDEIDHTGCSVGFFEAKSAINHRLSAAKTACNAAMFKYNQPNGRQVSIVDSIFQNELHTVFMECLKLASQPQKMREDLLVTIDRQIP